MAPRRNNHFGGKDPVRNSSMGRETILGFVPKKFNVVDQRSSSLGRHSIFGFRQTDKQNAQTSAAHMPQKKPEQKIFFDKAAQQQFINNIFEFLTTHDYDQQTFSKKILQTPSSKTFLTILEFLFRKFGRFRGSIYDLTDEQIFSILRHMGYQYSMPRNWLTAMNAPSTWASALYMLNWFCDVLRCDHAIRGEIVDIVEKLNEDGMDIFMTHVKEQFAEYKKTRERILANPTTTGTPEALAATISKFEVKQSETRASISEHETRIEGLKLALRNLEANQPDLVEMDNRISDAQQRLLNLREIFNEKQRELQRLQHERNERKHGNARLEEQLTTLGSEEIMLKNTLDTQELTKDDEEKLLKEITKQDGVKQRLRTQKIERQRQNYDIQAQLDEIYSNLDINVQTFNEIINSYPNIQQVCSVFHTRINHEIFADLNNFEEDLQHNRLIYGKMLGFDYKTQAKPALHKLSDELSRAIKDAEAELISLGDTFTLEEDKFKDMQQKYQTGVFDLRALTDALDIENDMFQRATNEFNDRKEALHKEILALRTAKAELEALKLKEAEAYRFVQEDLDKKGKEMQSAKKEMLELVKQDLLLVANHKRDTNEKLKALDQRIAYVQEKVSQDLASFGVAQ